MKKIIAFLILHYSFLIFNCFAQPGWEIIPSGTNVELNSIFFYDYEVGFACGNSGTVIKSIDSGKTWQALQTPVTYNLNDLYVFNDSTLCVVGNYGTIISSSDGGANWFGGSSFLSTEDYLSISFSDTKGVCGGSSQTILYGTFQDASMTWIVSQSGFFGGGFWGAYTLTPQIGFVAGENSIFQPLFGKSTDSGINWDFTAFYFNNNEGRATGVDFTDLNTGYVSARVWDGTGAIAKTTNGGSNWITTFFSNPLWSVDFPISGASLIGYAVGDQGTILKTYNAGDNWQQQISGTSLRLNKVHFKDIDFGFAVGENGTILRTWNGEIPVELILFTATANKTEVILEWSTATETNNQGFEILRFAQNDNNGWNKIGFIPGHGTTTETQHYLFTDNDVEPGKYQYNLKQIDYDGSYEYSQIIEAVVDAPTKFSLEQNYPNPFNPTTKIKFTIPSVTLRQAQSDTWVTLKVYDVLGNEVATLVNEELPAGEYKVEFSPETSIKQPASGIYFYQLKAGSFVETRKMMLLK
jgi:photosystem II stability/assembly factor-like uncharacterized protein